MADFMPISYSSYGMLLIQDSEMLKRIFKFPITLEKLCWTLLSMRNALRFVLPK